MASALLLVCALLAYAAPALGDVQSHINIGFRPADTTVAQNGLVAARYAVGAPNPVKIDQYFPWLEFFITLTGGFNATPSQDYYASVTNTNSTVETASVDLITTTGTLTPAQDAVVRVHMACNTTGQDTVTLQIDLAGFDSILVAWTKLCVFNGTNTKLNVATADWTHTIEMGNVVREGATLPLWQGDDSAGAGNFVLLNASVNEQKFFLWMYRGHQFYRIVADESDLDKVDVSLSATSGVATRQTPGGWTSNFTLTMRCLCDNCFGFVSVELQVDPYDPIAIAFFKDCTKSPGPTPPPSPSWSSTAVAFFVLSMLGTLACVGGCAFNYHSRGARGTEMIPCIGVMRNAWASVAGRGAAGGNQSYDVFPSSVGPQAEFEGRAASSSSGASKWQSRDATSYGSTYQNL